MPKPSLKATICLKCPSCSQTPLRKPGAFFSFRKACNVCRYCFERDEGNFWGAAMIINYGFIGLLVVTAGLIAVPMGLGRQPLLLAAILSIPAVVFGVLFQPWARALWIYLEMHLRPLEEEDHRRYEKLSEEN